LNANGQPEFAYPEIAGYYLSWLAFLSRLRPEVDVHAAATSVVEWLESITRRDGVPATRYYFDDRDDWRNNATFTFDLTMLCRGLHAIRGFVPEQSRRYLLQTFLRELLPEDDSLPAVINVRGQLRDCWSTRPGPFQLKTAAALLALQKHPAVWGTFYRWQGKVLKRVDPHELHAAFYALEGLMQFGVAGKSEALREAATCFEILFPCIDDRRSDVIAQGLRLGYTLRRLGFLQTGIWNDRLAQLRVRLEPFIADSGAVSFRSLGHIPVHFNTWAAIFAHQYFASQGK
jgi:hypothetical protein